MIIPISLGVRGRNVPALPGSIKASFSRSSKLKALKNFSGSSFTQKINGSQCSWNSKKRGIV